MTKKALAIVATVGVVAVVGVVAIVVYRRNNDK